MKIKTILNNNAVLVRTDSGEEAIVIERGIGFHSKIGDVFQKNPRQKIFVIQNDASSRHFKELIVEVPYEIFEVCQNIIEYTRNNLSIPLDNSFLVTLTDHVKSSIDRVKEGIHYRNLLLWDTKLLYPKEYEIGVWACAHIRETLGYELGPDEAAVIAMHIVNSETGHSADTVDLLIDIQAILRIIRYHMMKRFDIESLSYYRFVVHIKFLLERIKRNVQIPSKLGADVYQELIEKYPEEYRCAQKISAYLEEGYHYKMCHDEVIFLLVHIVRLMDATVE